MDRRRTAAELAGAHGFVDLCAELVVGDARKCRDGKLRSGEVMDGGNAWSNEEVLIRVGGRWDLGARAWSKDEPETVVVYRAHRGQEPAARWTADWLRRYITDDWADYQRVYTALMRGGRRSGKTHLADVFVILFAVAMRGREMAALSPVGKTSFELDVALQRMMPGSWYERYQPKEQPLVFEFPHGTFIRFFSGKSYRKSGRVDFAFCNEFQQFPRETYLELLGAGVDSGGLVLGASNPADDLAGAWVDELFTAAQEGEVDAVAFDMSPKKNPLITQEALESMRKVMTSAEVKREIEGKEVALGDAVMYAWSSDLNYIDPPRHFVDVTASFLKSKLGIESPLGACMDFQGSPFMAGRLMKVYRDPAGGLHPWCVAEANVEGDESALSRALVQLGADPATTPAIIDASGFYQDGSHNDGRTSDRTLRGCGWRFLLKPQATSDRNPSVKERLKNGNRLLCNDLGEAFLHIARACPQTAEEFKKWQKVKGVPSGRSKFSHGPTAITYFTYRLFPLPAGFFGTYIPVKRFSRREQMRGGPI